MGRDFRYYGRRPARDEASLLKVDDLINMALGTTDKNVIDFKMLQFILYILAGHINILEQMVELRLPRGGELSTSEEYYEDAGRVESYKKPAKREKEEKAPADKKEDDFRHDGTDGIDRRRIREGTDGVAHKGGRAEREQEYENDSKERGRGEKKGERDDGDRKDSKKERGTSKDKHDSNAIDRKGTKKHPRKTEDSDSDIDGKRGVTDDSSSKGGKRKIRKGKENDADDYDETNRRGTKKRGGKAEESKSEIEFKDRSEKRDGTDDSGRRGGKGETRTDKDNLDTDEIDRRGIQNREGKEKESDNDIEYRDRDGKGTRRKGKDRDVYENGTDEIYRRVPKKAEESDSDIEYKDKAGKKGERKDADESKGKDYKDRVKDKEVKLDTHSSKRARRTSDDESVDGFKVKRTKSLDTENKEKGQGRDEKYEKIRSRSLDSHRDKRGKQSKDISDEYVGGSLIGDESERVSTGIRYTSTGDNQRKSDRVGKRSSDGSIGGARRSRDNNEYKERPRKSCDTGVKRIPTKRIEEKEGGGGHRAGRAENSRAGRDENIEDLKSDGGGGSKGGKYMEDGGSVGKGKGRETKDKGKERGGRDLEDNYLDGGKSGRGKRKGEDTEDVERGETRGRKADKGYKDERKGKKYHGSEGRDTSQKFQTDDGKHGKKYSKRYNVDAIYFSGDSDDSDLKTGLKYVDHEFPAQPRPRGKSEDVKSTGMSSDDSKGSEYDDNYSDQERRRDDYEKASERQGKKVKDAKGIASRGAGRDGGRSESEDGEKYRGGEERVGKASKGKWGDKDEIASVKSGKKGRDIDAESIGSRGAGRGGKDKDVRGRRRGDSESEDTGDDWESRKGKMERKGGERSGGPEEEEDRVRKKRYIGDLDEDDSARGKDRKVKAKGKLEDRGKDGTTRGRDDRGRGKGYLDESDEDDDTGVKDRKEKGKGKVDNRGKDADEDKGLESKDRKGRDTGKVGDKDTSGKGGRKGDRDYEGQQRGRGKGGYDDEDEDDMEGRVEAGARSGKPGVSQRAEDKDAAGRKKGKAREGSITSAATGITIGSRGREGGGPRVGSIEMVTQDQFKQLERAVKELQKKAGPMAAPILPENSTLLMDISKGAVSLTDVIQALQIQARLQAAERAIERMTDLIAQLAAAGALSPEALARIADIRSEFSGLSTLQMRLPPIMESHLPSTVASKGGASSKGRHLQESSAEGGLSGAGLRWNLSEQDEMSMGMRDFSAEGGMSMSKAASKGSSAAPSMGRSIRSTTGCITPDEMREAISAMREQFMEKANRLGGVANQKAITAEATSKTLAEKLTDVLGLNDAVTEGYNKVNDYAAVLYGFDSGIETQMSAYNQQLNIIRNDLREGLIHLDKSCNNAETRPILDLREDMDLLEGQRNDTRHTHKALTTKQEDLDFKVKDLMETVELLREIKVDKDEVEDALKDKADLQRINGIVNDEDFNNVYTEMEVRLQMCLDKFRAQDNVWTRAAQELNAVVSDKCETSDMESTRNQLLRQMRLLGEKARKAANLLEDPKVAVLARRLYKESSGAVKAPTDVTLVSEARTATPRQTYQSRTTGDGAEDDVCCRPYIEQVCGRPYAEQVSAGLALTADEDDRRSHICKRWCGGSHTLVNETVTRELACPFPTSDGGALRRRIDQGTDNKLYMMAYPATCNCTAEKIPGEAEELSSHHGAGDRGGNPTIVTGQEARRVTVVCDADLRLMRVETGGGLRGPAQRGSADSRPSATGTLPPIDSKGFKNKVGVIVQGRFTVVDEATPIEEAGRRTSLAEERILEQLATFTSSLT